LFVYFNRISYYLSKALNLLLFDLIIDFPSKEINIMREKRPSFADFTVIVKLILSPFVNLTSTDSKYPSLVDLLLIKDYCNFK
jgi:hypothetical protein